MKVLWFTNAPSNYAPAGGYNGGGWISSLETEITKRENIQLAVTFFMNNQPPKVRQSNVVYYPINYHNKRTFIGKVHSKLTSHQKKEQQIISKFLDIIRDFKPDVIEVFGSEQSFGLISKYTKIPVLLHIQGILTSCYNAFLPPFISKYSFYFENFNPIKFWHRFNELRFFRLGSQREIEILKNVNYFIGRTEWDKRIVLLYHPNANYFYGSEILRDIFYMPIKRTIPNQLTIVTTISDTLYKGYDTVLKAAEILKKIVNKEFIWNVYGNVNSLFIERKLKINHHNVNVNFKGVASAEVLEEALIHATCFVHPSYIDNSPNSICEAQMAGIPVIATNVGGIPSLINDGKNGFLIPANDPFQMAYLIGKLYFDKTLNVTMGTEARSLAIKRHNKFTIVNDLLNTYNQIINNSNIQ